MQVVFLGTGMYLGPAGSYLSVEPNCLPITVRTLCHKPVAPSKVSAKASSPRPCFTTKSNKSLPGFLEDLGALASSNRGHTP